MTDLRDLVGDDLEPGERERLQRVHELLDRVGPPPELSPGLQARPDPPRASVIPLPRRYRFTALAAAAVVAASLFGVGYLVGAAGDAVPVRTLAMSGAGGASATLDLFAEDAAGNWPMELEVRDLAPGDYELWLTRDGKLAAPCGDFVVAGEKTTVPLNAPYRLRRFDAWVVVENGKTKPVLTT
ncbi:MAG: hypothetical protein H0W16_04500 [Actinobacteria bacterium]|nr:hypothetical protein [Actinomycetota bacterium]